MAVPAKRCKITLPPQAQNVLRIWFRIYGSFPCTQIQKKCFVADRCVNNAYTKMTISTLILAKTARIALNHVLPCITWFQALGASLMQNPNFCKGLYHNCYTKTAISTLIPAQTCAWTLVMMKKCFVDGNLQSWRSRHLVDIWSSIGSTGWKLTSAQLCSCELWWWLKSVLSIVT